MIEESIECYKAALQTTTSSSTIDLRKNESIDGEQYNAKAILLNNLSSAYSILKNYDKARKQLQTIRELMPSELISQKELIFNTSVALEQIYAL